MNGGGWLAAGALAFATSFRASSGEDFSQRYPATMTWSQQGLPWTCGEDDVWKLSGFELHQGKDLSITCGKCQVVFGVHDTNVLWAVVFPEKAAEVEADDHPDVAHAGSILLRFAPGDVGRLFPKKTIAGAGDSWLRARGDRLFRHKVGWKWYTPSGNPTVVPAGFVIVDLDTEKGERRFFGVDSNAGKVEYVAEFEAKKVPPLAPIERRAAEDAFDQVWKAFDREYAQFELLPDVDWDALQKRYQKEAAGAKTVFDCAAVISDMLAKLQNLHVWVKAGDDFLPMYSRERPLNASYQAVARLVGATREEGKELAWARTEDGIGYLQVTGLSDAELPAAADRALEALADTWAMIVDLRFNGGGDELLGGQVAARFLDEERVYSTNRYRSGSEHDDLGEVLQRKLAPRGPWRYAAPTIALFGQKTLSSAESMALMLAQCPQVTTMGDRTGGSSGNPRLIELAVGITVNLPRWLDMDPDGHPIERAGIAPDVPIATKPEDFTETRDPVLEAALERLRKIPKGERKPGRG
jgi:hypothetical protein